MTARKLLASMAFCGVLLAAGCIQTPTDGQKAAQGSPQPSVTVIQPTTVTKTCEGPCTRSHTSSRRGSAAASVPSAGPTRSASAPTATANSAPTTRTYSRDEFGNGWADPDGNGCDGRQDAVARATTDQHRTSRCYIATGDVTDWYTGKVCNDCPTRGFDVDHVFPLHRAWQAGAWKWTRAKRIAFANDPANLVLTSASLNRSKSDQGPDTWAPPMHAAACKYVNRFALVGRIWRLNLNAAERAAVRKTKATC